MPSNFNLDSTLLVISDSIILTCSPADMPFRNSKYIPRTFKGQPAYLQEFFENLESLFKFHNVSTDCTDIKMLFRYCHTGVREILETLSGYISLN